MMTADIAIVGGGASCVLLLAALSQIPEAKGLRVDVFERVPSRLGRGIAYSTPFSVHLLNVRAGNMSALEEDREDFTRWAITLGYGAQDFVPRKNYGDYLAEKLELAKSYLNVTFVEADVQLVRKLTKTEYEVSFGLRKKTYRRVVLATGNVRPIQPKVDGAVAGYYDDPWTADYAELAKKKHIGLVGSGLSAVDTVLALYSKNYDGKISIFSRHALPPAPHVAPASYPDFLTREDETKSPYYLFHLIRGEIKKAKAEHIPWQAVIDSLRPHTNPVWENMPKRTREKFMKRCFTLWNVHRHRMAPEIGKALSVLQKAGRVEFVKSSVDLVKEGPLILGSGGEFKPDAVINCMGYRYKEEKRTYDVSDKIGPVRFGDQFETTAIPEIRSQAAQIARDIMQSF